ncbi:MAG: FHA domain-containing protein, partial [Dehalococcoidia bacterium]|nr:FHA domain-containing protein [Dehalococcoidia bacterium]
QAPSDPPLPGHHPPFPPPLPPHPFPPMPPTPPNPWTPGPWQWPITWRWSPYIRTIPPVQQVRVVERPVVQPVYAPVISSFTASPSYIQPGYSTTLTWSVNNASTVSISPTIGTVASSGSYTLTPGSTTTYVLSAGNGAGTVTASTTVTVAPVLTTYTTTSSASVQSVGTSIITGGINSDGSPTLNLWLMYGLLIGLLAVAAAVIVTMLMRKPAAAYAGTRASYAPSTTVTTAATDYPRTTALASGLPAKFVTPKGDMISLAGSSGSLGRHDFQSLLAHDRADLISRQHVFLGYEKGEYFIEDRNSTNGTRLNGASIKGRGRQQLRDGDSVELANAVSLTFKA